MYDNDEISEKRIRELADMYLKINNSVSLKAALDVLGFKNVKGEMIKNDDNSNEKLNVKYNDFRKKMLEYFTSDYLDNFYKFDTNNGYITAPALGGDGGANTEIVTIKKVSSNKYKIDYNETPRGEGGETSKDSITITVKFEDGKYVISEVINGNSSSTDNTNEVSEERIRELADMYLKINNSGSLKAALDVLGFKNVKGEMINNNGYNGYGTEKLNVKYNDFKKKMLEYFTNDYLNEYYKFDTDNGYITEPALGGDGGADTEIVNINKVSSNKYRIIYNSKGRGDDGESFKESMIITFKFENGKYVISNIDIEIQI